MRSVLAMLAILVGGCGDDEAEKACEDYADGAGEMGERCFPDDPNAYDALHDAAVNAVDGDCGNVIDIRDMDELYDECLPWMEDVACSIVQDEGFALDSACRDQLLH